MAFNGDQEDGDTTLGPSSVHRNDGLSFKPPTRPGASLRGRKSTAALSEINQNRNQTSSSSLKQQFEQSPDARRATSPTSSLEAGSDSSHVPPSSKEARALALTQSARQRLHVLSEETDHQTTAAGRLGQGLLEQSRKIEQLQEEMNEELSALEHSQGDDEYSRQRFDKVDELAQKVEKEIREMATQRKQLLLQLLPTATEANVLPASDSSSTSGLSTYAFLASDPSTRSVSGKNNYLSDSLGSSPSSAHASGTTMRQSDRRARNAAAPTSLGDQNLVNQLQEGLVNEIRRLQGLLSERERQVKTSDEERKKSEEELALWKPKALAFLEREDAMKQESWDLNIQVQDLKVALDTERTSAKKLEGERNRINKELAKSREVSDERKIQLENQAAELEKVRNLRETETAMARKDKATMQREYSDLQTEVAKFKAQALKLERAAGVSRSVSNSLLGPDGSILEDNEEGSAAEQAARRRTLGDGPPASPGSFSEDFSNGAPGPTPSRAIRDREVSDLRGKLTMAQKKSGKDSAEKRRLREQNAELRKLLSKAGLDAPADSDVESSGEDENEWTDVASVGGKRAVKRTRRIPKSSTKPNMALRLGLGSSSMAEEDGGGEEDTSFDTSFQDDRDQSSQGHGSLEGADTSGEYNVKGRRRSTIRPNTKRFSTGSPLVHNVALSEEQEDEREESFEEHPAPRFPTGHRGVAPRLRPASAVVPAAALGNELEDELGRDNSLTAPSRGSIDMDGSVIVHAAQKQNAEHNVQTDAVADPVGPALEAQAAEHEREIAEVKAHHKAQLAEAIESHEEGLRQLHATHKAVVEGLQNDHTAALEAQEAKSSARLALLEREHESLLAEKEGSHTAAIAAALAAQRKTHDAGISEARNRHTQALADQLAAHGSAISDIETAHRSALAEQVRLHKAELEKREHRHQQALREKSREHDAMVEDINSTNDAFQTRRDAAYNAALKDRDEQVVKARAEIQRLQSELERVRSQLVEAQHQLSQAADDQEKRIKELEAAQAAHIAALAAATAETEEVRRDAMEAETRAAEAAAQAAAAEAIAASRRQSMSVDHNDDFQDAVADQQSVAEEEGVRRVVLADLSHSGVQTDDQMWATYQQEKLMMRPQSVALAKPGETSVGPGGITVLGSQRGRPRDSVGTFGGAAERGSSPTPTSFSVSALEGGDGGRDADGVDKSKPPVLAVPPPPVMPPPTLVPRKSNASVLTYQQQDSSTQTAPGRPTSPPPAKLLHRASRASGQLRLPTESDSLHPPRSGSRASQYPPSSYISPSRGKVPRRSSNVSGAGVGDSDSIGSASILSRLSQRHHARQTSGASQASDVTSEMSHRQSDASWQGRGGEDDDEDAGDITINAGTANGPARRGVRGFVTEATDAKVIQAITQTMIGDYMYKYTRKSMGRGGHSDKRHRRYFWVHPYTKMLYWTITDPGGAQMAEGVSKSAAIEDVRTIEDYNNSPAGLHHISIVIQTGARELKLTAQSRPQHEMWFQALSYLVDRDSEQKAAADATLAASDAASIRRPRSRASTAATTASRAVRLLSPGRSLAATGRTRSNDSLGEYNDATPRARGAKGHPGGASEGYSTRSGLRTRGRQTAPSLRSVDDWGRNQEQRDPRLLKTAEEMLEENEEQARKEGFESLDNVRACCGGLHDVGDLAHKHHVAQQQAKQRRGSLTPSTMMSNVSRPSSRLSQASGTEKVTRPRASAPSMSSVASSMRVTSPPPQLGPLNLNGPLRSSQKGGAKAKESLTSMFEMPHPPAPHSAKSSTRGKSGQSRSSGEYGSSGVHGTATATDHSQYRH